VERPDFPEYPVLKVWLEEKFPSFGMSRIDFAKGNWLEALEGAISHTRRFPVLSADGAVSAAEIILSRLEGKE